MKIYLYLIGLTVTVVFDLVWLYFYTPKVIFF